MAQTVEPTNNPIPSNDLVDARFNVQSLDIAANSQNLTYQDRFKNTRFTLQGAMLSLTLEAPVDYAAAIVISRRTQVIRYNGLLYTYTGDLPYTTTGNVATDGLDPFVIGRWSLVSNITQNGIEVFDTNAQMLAADLQPGQQVARNGLDAAFDGCHAEYFIMAPASAPPADGHRVFDLANGNRAVLKIEGDIYVEQFGAKPFDTTFDCRPAIQAAIEFAQSEKSMGGRRTVTSRGSRFYVLTTYPGTLPSHATGKNVIFWVEDIEFCRLDFGDGSIFLLGDTPAIQNVDEIFCICQESGDQARADWSNMLIEGGSWTDTTDEPDYGIRADYNVMKYSQFKNIEFRRVREAHMRVVGFVISINECDFRFCRDGIQALTASIDGNAAARTGHNYTNNTFDFCERSGFVVSGGNGHTYCQFVNNNADHCGRDRSNNTIVANIPDAASYILSAVFSSEMSACGSEFSTRYARFLGCRGLHVDTLYSNGNGSTDAANPVDYEIVISGFAEQMHINNYRQSGRLNASMRTLQIGTPAQFNNNSLLTDASIPANQVNTDTVQTVSSAPALVFRVEDTLVRSVKNPGGDALLMGDKGPGANTTAWFDQMLYTPSKNFLFNTNNDPLDATLVTLTNPSNLGLVGFDVEIMVVRSSDTTAGTPSRYIGTAAMAGGTPTVTGTPDKITPTGDGIAMTMVWDGNDLKLQTSITFVAMAVTVRAFCNPGSGNQTFEWGPTQVITS